MDIIDRRLDDDFARDFRRHRWNHALATGDPATIDAVADEILTETATAIMNDTPNYAVAGWTPT